MEVKQKNILVQNYPNPFNNNTNIECFIPHNCAVAKLLLTDMKGNIIRIYEISGRDKTTFTISSVELQSGNYIYTLINDGIIVDSKQMKVFQ